MDSSVTMPPVTLTPDESAREGELGTVLSTMRNEYFSKIIMGQLPVDAYDEMCIRDSPGCAAFFRHSKWDYERAVSMAILCL